MFNFIGSSGNLADISNSALKSGTAGGTFLSQSTIYNGQIESGFSLLAIYVHSFGRAHACLLTGEQVESVRESNTDFPKIYSCIASNFDSIDRKYSARKRFTIYIIQSDVPPNGIDTYQIKLVKV